MTSPRTMPKWLQTNLELAGRLDTDGIRRRARMAYCSDCGQPIMIGLDADRAGLPAYCDPAPISTLGEAAALLLGRATYALRWIGFDGYRISMRTPWDIRAHPAGTQPDIEVLAEHRCGTRLPETGSPIHAPPRSAPLPETPPF